MACNPPSNYFKCLFLRSNGLIYDPVQRLQKLRNIGRIPPLRELLIDGLQIVAPFGLGESGRLRQERLEPDEHLPR